MSDVAVSVRGLGKKYHLAGARQQYRTLRDSLQDLAAAPFNLLRRGHAVEKNPPFWALKDVSFEVRRGEVVGIIGRNGAGKSTLLKVLSRITEPTEGEVDIHGRVGSLLEVGTGFHPELTGRENVYLNGAILGMRKADIARKFDEIVAFAEVEKFIDTPVKHYSSGMYMRLAFAVAAHLEPEILIVDEVLAVGDADFQKKCLGKMGDVASHGRTVLFVSHNIAAIEQLTKRCVLLEKGKVSLFDTTRNTIAQYTSTSQTVQMTLADWPDRSGDGTARIVKFESRNMHAESRSNFTPLEPIRLLVGVDFQSKVNADVGIVVETIHEQAMFATHLSDSQPIGEVTGYREFEVLISPNYLRQGKYLVSLAIGSAGWTRMIDVILHFPAFNVQGVPHTGFFPTDSRWGPLFLEFQWKIE